MAGVLSTKVVTEHQVTGADTVVAANEKQATSSITHDELWIVIGTFILVKIPVSVPAYIDVPGPKGAVPLSNSHTRNNVLLASI